MLPLLGGLVLMFVLMYFFTIRPQKKQEKEQQQMRDNLAIGDEVTSIGGIVGKIVAVYEETVIIETSKDKTHIRLLRRAIGSIDVKAEDNAAVPVKAKETPEQAPAEPAKRGKKGKKSTIAPETPKDEAPALETPDLETFDGE
jgi:preprotein translocase subunit YajC